MEIYRGSPLVVLKTVSSLLRGSNICTPSNGSFHWLIGDNPHQVTINFQDQVDEGRMLLIDLIGLANDITNEEELVIEVIHKGTGMKRVSRLVGPRIVQIRSDSQLTNVHSNSLLAVVIEYSHIQLWLD